jgi:hypothetical protein
MEPAGVALGITRALRCACVTGAAPAMLEVSPGGSLALAAGEGVIVWMLCALELTAVALLPPPAPMSGAAGVDMGALSVGLALPAACAAVSVGCDATGFARLGALVAAGAPVS